MKNFFRNYFLFILFSLFFVKATGEKKTNIYGYNNNIRLYLTSGLIDASVRNYMNSNGIGEVKIIGQAAIDPKNNLTLNVELLKRGILLQFPSVSGKGIGVLDWEGKAMTALRDPSSSGYSQAINLFIQAIRIAKKMRPNVRWGYYALPYRTFWGMDDLWRKNNEGLKSILNETDIIFPSVYMLYTDGQVTSGKNRSYISNNISLALRLGQICNKPVMPFVTDRWQPSAKGFANKVIPKTDFVKYISEINKVVYNNHTISGIVWWGSPFYDYKMKNPVVRAEARSESEFVDIQDNLIINYCREIKALP